jgi:hypothetical protein
MQFNEVHILFEQSGTFKKVFADKKYTVREYDIENTPAVDISCDIFEHIDREYQEIGGTIFENIPKGALVLAFFPCTYFSDQSQLVSRGDSAGQKHWNLYSKLDTSARQMGARAIYYQKLCRLCIIADRLGYNLVIENPLGKCGFLKQYFPIKERVVIKDRTKLGDYFKKPTQFFFVNCKPTFNLEKESEWNEFQHKVVEQVHGFDRSRISPEFAKNFVELFLEE